MPIWPDEAREPYHPTRLHTMTSPLPGLRWPRLQKTAPRMRVFMRMTVSETNRKNTIVPSSQRACPLSGLSGAKNLDKGTGLWWRVDDQVDMNMSAANKEVLVLWSPANTISNVP
jgi:hypothetical protein